VWPVGVTFPGAARAGRFGVLFDCTWEMSHGFAVVFRGGKVVAVGEQGIIL
jgi:hypothetical protein